ncbi:hypothetical protein BDA96_04G091100 [Sorghum bicolor]|uniref:Uncharacterized protein n=1 Tax=Sorghum bicolor TaxID=4558 RepID=A0A921R4Z9_SORBI|nr:hypothetical protein BDA96_04G091100 [Sorghum bicolor]
MASRLSSERQPCRERRRRDVWASPGAIRAPQEGHLGLRGHSRGLCGRCRGGCALQDHCAEHLHVSGERRRRGRPAPTNSLVSASHPLFSQCVFMCVDRVKFRRYLSFDFSSSVQI